MRRWLRRWFAPSLGVREVSLALITLLIDKGVITRAELEAAIREAYRRVNGEHSDHG